MAALTQDRRTSERAGKDFYFPVATGVTIYAGSIVMLSATGFAKPATVTTGETCVGRCEEAVTNTGADGDVSVKVRKGVFAFEPSATNAPTLANVGDTLYAEDDQTVTTVDTGASAVGTCVDVNEDGVWVEV